MTRSVLLAKQWVHNAKQKTWSPKWVYLASTSRNKNVVVTDCDSDLGNYRIHVYFHDVKYAKKKRKKSNPAALSALTLFIILLNIC